MTIQIESNQIQDSAIVSSKIASSAISAAKLAADCIDESKISDNAIQSEHISSSSVLEAALASGAVAFGKLKSADVETSLTGGSAKLATAQAIKTYIDASSAGMEILDDVIDSVNASAAPPTSNSGDRYIIVSASTPNAGWGGLSFADGDVLEYNGTAWTLDTDVSVEGASKSLLAWNTTDGIWYKLSAGESSWTEHGGLAGVTAGTGLGKSGNTLNVQYDDTTIGVDGSDQLYLKDGSVAGSKLATNGVAADKINKSSSLTDAGSGALGLDSSVAGNGLSLSSQVMSVQTNGSTINSSASGIKVAASGITSTELANGSVSGSIIATNGVAADKINTDSSLTDTGAGALGLADGAVSTGKLADDSVTAAKVGFASNWDVLSPDGSATSFDLGETIDSAFAMLIVVRNGIVLKQVMSSPSGQDEYSVSLTGGSGGVTQLNFGSAPTNGADLRAWYMA